MKLVSADYSQIELRVLAHIADIPQLKKAFDDGLDIHAMTASEMFGVPVKDMPPEVRRRAKAINFGIIYGISAFGLANQLGISREEAGAYIKTYFERFPGIRDYMEATKKRAHEQGYVETVFGRRIHYPEINTKNPSMRGFLERAAINAPIQGSAADIIRRAMVRMPGALEHAQAQVGAACCCRCTTSWCSRSRTRRSRRRSRPCAASWRRPPSRRSSFPCRSTSTPRPPTTGRPRIKSLLCAAFYLPTNHMRSPRDAARALARRTFGADRMRSMGRKLRADVR